MFPGLCGSARWCNRGLSGRGGSCDVTPPPHPPQSISLTTQPLRRVGPQQIECFGCSSLIASLSPPLIHFYFQPSSPFSHTFLPPSLPPYQFHSPFFPSSHSHPRSLYTWGSCSFIANWTFHSERNNYSLERKGTAVECWYDTQCHLATQELPAHPTQSEAEGRGAGREGVREGQGWWGL